LAEPQAAIGLAIEIDLQPAFRKIDGVEVGLLILADIQGDRILTIPIAVLSGLYDMLLKKG
jgi:hypothetical protein